MDRSDPTEPHTSSTVDQSVAGLRMHALEMGALVIEQVACAVRALVDRDPVLAQAVLARESRVDQYEKQLDRDSLTFIALQQPVANDLRLARAIVRIGRELERAGTRPRRSPVLRSRLRRRTRGIRSSRSRDSCGTCQRFPVPCCGTRCAPR